MRQRKTLLPITAFVVTAAAVAALGISIVSASSDEPRDSTAETGEVSPLPDPPAPSEINPVDEPNRVGDVSEADRSACEQPREPADSLTERNDDLYCDVVAAVDAGLVEEGQELSNEELDRVRAEISEEVQGETP